MHFFDYEEMLELFKRLRFDEDWDYSISVYEFNLKWDQKEVVRFIDEFSRNEIAGEDITGLVRYEVDVIDRLRPMIERTNAHVAWERELDDSREVGSPFSVSDLERIFLIDQPVLFFGSIDEIEVEDASGYKIAVKPTSILPCNYGLEAFLHVVLTFDKEAMADVSEESPSFNGGQAVNQSVAVTAQFTKIEQLGLEDEYSTEPRAVAFGDLIEIVYTDQLTLRGYMRERVLERLLKP